MVYIRLILFWLSALNREQSNFLTKPTNIGYRDFCFANNTVVPFQTEKWQLFLAVQEMIKKHAVSDLGQVAPEIQSGSLNGNQIENGDLNHVIINTDGGWTLRFSGD